MNNEQSRPVKGSPDDREKASGAMRSGIGGGGKGEIKAERRLLIGFVWPKNCATELKLLVIALLLLCSLATLFQFFPLFSSSSSLRTCLSSTTVAISANSTAAVEPPPSRPSPLQQDQQLDKGILKRSFNPIGAAAYSFILMSAYRGGAATFAVNGLASKPLHVYGRPTYTCEYQADNESATAPGHPILPDWGYGRVYTTVVINCTFPSSSAASSTAGGRLLIHASTNGGFDRQLNLTQTIEALVEQPNSWNLSQFVDSPPKYDYLYCGSPLYGNLSPQRVREWIAFHVRLFGKRSHFVIYDAGGVHPEVMEVLKPWMELGYVSLHDIREQERFDGYYHNQFLVVNDCLHRYRFETKWMFFFDADEFIYVARNYSIKSVVDLYKNYTQIVISQMPISNKLCLAEDARRAPKIWGFEKLVYRDSKRVLRRNRKYAIQPRNVFATGVHLSQNLVGESTLRTDKVIRYFHYHGTISGRREPCRQFINETLVKVDGNPYVLDTTMRAIAPYVKNFELSTIGTRLQTTRQ